MITLITGTPGAGKTAYVVNELSSIHDRQLIIDGIPDLIIPHELPPEEGGGWPECGEPDSRNSRAVSEQRRYKLPKQIFSQYKSASLHVKPKHRLPKSVFIFMGCLILASILG